MIENGLDPLTSPDLLFLVELFYHCDFIAVWKINAVNAVGPDLDGQFRPVDDAEAKPLEK